MKILYNSIQVTGLKMMKKLLFFSLIAVQLSLPLLLTSYTYINEEDAICGVWYTRNNNSKVEIYNQNGRYFGRIIWMKDADKAQYTNKLVILDMKYNGSNKLWDGGSLYYPVKDAQYKGYLELHNRDTLSIRAYLGTPVIGKTITWVRVK